MDANELIGFADSRCCDYSTEPFRESGVYVRFVCTSSFLRPELRKKSEDRVSEKSKWEVMDDRDDMRFVFRKQHMCAGRGIPV